MCDVNTGLNKMINLEAKLSERLIGNLLFMSDVQTCILFTMSGNSFLKQELLSLLSYWSQLTTENKQSLCVCVLLQNERINSALSAVQLCSS